MFRGDSLQIKSQTIYLVSREKFEFNSDSFLFLFRIEDDDSNARFLEDFDEYFEISIVERTFNLKFIRVYDYNSLKVRFEHEISYDVGYFSESEFFHALEIDNGVFIGFLFATTKEVPLPENKAITSSEAKRFYNKVQSEKFTTEEEKEAKATFQAIQNKERRPSAWNRLKSAVMGDNSVKSVVGKPTNFEHKSHVGLLPDGTLDVNAIPSEWIPILKEVGLKKKDLKNPEISKAVLTTMNLAGMNNKDVENEKEIPKDLRLVDDVSIDYIKFNFLN